MEDSELNDLIPEMRTWNDGRGIDPTGWISCSGTFELAIGYSLIFWPRFVLIDDHVLGQGATEKNLREWERNHSGHRKDIEAVINHVHMADIHIGDPTEAQLRYLGRTLKQIYELKLKADFPDRTFVVSFPDEPDLDVLDYQLTFWQARD